MQSSRWKTILALLAIFLAGGVTGWLLHPAPRFPHPPRGSRELATHLNRRFERELAPTSEQVQAMAPFIEKAANELDRVRGENDNLIRTVMRDLHAQIRPILTPEQIRKLEEMVQRRRDRKGQ